MPRPILTHNQRLRISQAARHLSQRAVARRFNVSQSTVAYCVALTVTLASVPHTLCTTFSTTHKSRHGVKLNQTTLSQLKELFDTKPWASNTVICAALAESGTVISHNTLRKVSKLQEIAR